MIDFLPHRIDNQFTDPNQLLIYNFWAPWCSSCAMLKPVLHALEQEYGSRVSIISVNVDAVDIELASRFGIRYIPALVFIKNGRVVGQHTGATPYKDLDSKLTSLLNN